MRVLSFGAGVQSTALLLAAETGLIEPVDLVIFADTHAEPKSVYDWLKYCESVTKAEIVKVSAGDIVADSLSGERFASAPFYILKNDGTTGMLRRQCTAEYKIKPIQNYLRRFKGEPISLLMGISTDEAQRAKESRVKWIKHEFPLLWLELNAHCGGVLGWNRQMCIEYVEQKIGATPPKSACHFCPYRDDKGWAEMKETEPDTFARAVEFDKKIREHRSEILKGEMFVHKSVKPLGEIDFVKAEKDRTQLTFADECEGMCGT